jgi:zinc transporter ZupT
MSRFEEDPINETEEIFANGCLKPMLVTVAVIVAVAAIAGAMVAYFIFGR